MKAARASVKGQSRLPYSTVTHIRQRDGSLLSRVARNVGAAMTKLKPLWRHRPTKTETDEEATAATLLECARAVPALRPGDVLRDRAFLTHSSEVVYCSTHPSLCAEVFGLVPGEILEFMRECGGSVFGQLVMVVGARGGKLWVLVEGEAAARALHIPPVHTRSVEHSVDGVATVADAPPAAAPSSLSSVSASPSISAALAVRAAVLAHYDAHLVHHPLRALTPAETHKRNALRGVFTNLQQLREESATLQRAQIDELDGRLSELQAEYAAVCQRAQEEARRVYTADQQAFLQRAPDLYVAALPHTSTVLEQQQHIHHNISNQRHSVGDEVKGELDVSSPAPVLSVYAALARGEMGTSAVVLLTPRIAVATSTVGWTGEGDVSVSLDGTDGSCGEGSLSASIVI